MLYDEAKDYDNTKLWSSPNPTVVGGNINPENLPQAKVDGRCINLYPHQRLRVNTIFEVVHEHCGQTAYTDKHPAYDLVRGPSGKGLSVAYFPEIQSLDSESTTAVTRITDLASMSTMKSTKLTPKISLQRHSDYRLRYTSCPGIH